MFKASEFLYEEFPVSGALNKGYYQTSRNQKHILKVHISTICTLKVMCPKISAIRCTDCAQI